MISHFVRQRTYALPPLGFTDNAGNDCSCCRSDDWGMWRGRLRINAPVSFGVHALSRRLPEYLASYPDDLAHHECLGVSYTELRTRWAFEGQDGQTISVAVRGKLMVDSGEALLIATRAGMGILLQPDEMVRDDLATGGGT